MKNKIVEVKLLKNFNDGRKKGAIEKWSLKDALLWEKEGIIKILDEVEEKPKSNKHWLILREIKTQKKTYPVDSKIDYKEGSEERYKIQIEKGKIKLVEEVKKEQTIGEMLMEDSKHIKQEGKDLIMDSGLQKQKIGSVGKDEKEEYDQINEYIWDEEKLIQKKSFPMDLHKDIFYFGLLLPRNALEKDKKGNVLGMRQDLFNVLITKKDKPKLIQYSKRIKEDLGLSFTSFPSYLPHRWKLDKIKKFLDGETKLVDGKELLDKIFKQYEKYLYIRNPTWYKIHSIWDIGTYLYQLFEAYPLFELRGIADTGKSKSMGISSYMSFNGGQIMVNPSEATLFRETEEVRGAKYFDEAEKLWIYNKSTKQYEGDVRTELINASYTKEAKVPRQEKVGNKFITKWYSPYSPTQLSSINGLFGATETRAITRITTKSPNEDKRGEIDPAEDRKNDIWNEVRDECYRFALENWKELKEMYNKFPKDCGLKRRDYQIWKPILTISKFISEETYKEILKFAIEMTKRKTEDLIHESSFDYFCLSAMKEVLETNPEYNKVYINSIKFAYCNAKGDEEGKKDIYLNRNISNHLDKLGFKEFRDRDNKLAFFAITKEIFNEIVSPICPNIVFLSPPSPPSPLNDKLHIKNNKKSVDEVVIGVDSKNKNKKKVVMSGENGENGDTWRLEDNKKSDKKDKKIQEYPKEEIKTERPGEKNG